MRKFRSSWQLLTIRDMNKSWTFPKGMIEKGESPLAAARREIEEEVGLTNLTLLRKLGVIEYFFRKNGLIKKTVHYFLFRSTGRQKLKPQRKEGISAAKWVSLEEFASIIGYPNTNRPLFETVQKIVAATHKK